MFLKLKILRQESGKNYIPNPQNRLKRRNRGIQTECPKWARWVYSSNSYSCEKTRFIPTFDNKVWLFAIMEKHSRLIVHACLRKQESRKYTRYPVWFNLHDCLTETFEEYGLPFGFISDGLVLKYQRELCGIEAIQRAESPRYIASLESFFGILQREMRTDLTQIELDKYIRYWNEQRVLSTIGKTPKQLWDSIDFL
jgi:hypothetical protein